MKLLVFGKISGFLAFMIIEVEAFTRIEIKDMRLVQVLVKGFIIGVIVLVVIGISVRVRLVEMVSPLVFEKV